MRLLESLPRRVSSILGVLFFSASLLQGACTTMTPARIPVTEPVDSLMVSARRALVEQGLDVGEEDPESGVLRSDWTVSVNGDEATFIYRIVILFDRGDGERFATVRVETQKCPPASTVFDRCQPWDTKFISKRVQAQIDAVGAALSGE